MNDGLFGGLNSSYTPLAHLLRPIHFESVLGQSNAIKILQNLKKPTSILLYGPPGSGKTTLGSILAKKWNLSFEYLSAISIGVKEIKEIIARTSRQGSIIIFLDEIHRFSSSQQDSLLEAVETGRIILIGATTENPAFRINRPLLSRMILVKLNGLLYDDLSQILDKGCNNYNPPILLSQDSKDYLIHISGGDARKLLTYLESLKNVQSDGILEHELVKGLLEQSASIYDKTGENHYDYISAFIKSVRGSDPDAAILYLAYMLEGGEDPLFIMRRLVILASEDIGNTTPGALSVAMSGMHALEAIGMPEGRIILAQVTTYLAGCPKSNAAYESIEKASVFVKKNSSEIKVPNHLRNAPTFIHKLEGAGKNYIYPHSLGGFVDENYFPENFKSLPQFYFPTENGQEKAIRERLKNLWQKTGKKKYD